MPELCVASGENGRSHECCPMSFGAPAPHGHQRVALVFFVALLPSAYTNTGNSGISGISWITFRIAMPNSKRATGNYCSLSVSRR